MGEEKEVSLLDHLPVTREVTLSSSSRLFINKLQRVPKTHFVET